MPVATTTVSLDPDAPFGGTTLSGTLEAIRWHQDGYLIGRLREGGTGRLVAIKGPCIQPQVGGTYHLDGRWTCSPIHGDTFAFTTYGIELPTEPESVICYLRNTARFIGPAIGQAIVDRYGRDTMAVLKGDPDRVAADIRGITPERARDIRDALLANERAELVTIRIHGILTGTGLGKSVVQKVLHRWGHLAVETITANPFELTALRGVGFPSADRVRARLGVAHESPSRIEAGIMHALTEATSGSGHTYLAHGEFRRATQDLLMVPVPVIEAGVARLQEKGDVHVDLVTTGGAPGYHVALGEIRRAEERIAGHVACVAAMGPVGAAGGIDTSGLADDQVEALRRLVTARIFILTGAPGTGKTYLVRRIMASLPPGRTALAAPTGKAAQRIFEQTGTRASTIHRLLEATPSDHGFFFRRDAGNPLEHDVVILDEASMIDVRLMASFLAAMPLAGRIVIIGDTNQLPSVGPGSVLRDLIASGAVETAELRTIKRQDAGLIIRNCHAIRDGLPVTVDNWTSSDFFWQDEADAERVAEAIVDLLRTRLPAQGFDPLKDVQVLAPLRERGVLSCDALNTRLQAALNPNRPMANPARPNETLRFAVGDKVMQTANDYGIGVFNGEIGAMRAIDARERTYTVAFDGPERVVHVKWDEADLALAYAITVHKSQGSEWPVVVMPVHRSQRSPIMDRNLLYTAISRARSIYVGVGQQSEIPRIVSQQRNARRNTKLEQLVRAAAGVREGR